MPAEPLEIRYGGIIVTLRPEAREGAPTVASIERALKARADEQVGDEDKARQVHEDMRAVIREHNEGCDSILEGLGYLTLEGPEHGQTTKP